MVSKNSNKVTDATKVAIINVLEELTSNLRQNSPFFHFGLQLDWENSK